MKLIAHRGASHDAPENTLAALRLGYAQGADAGEVDVHLSRDARIVVHHDADTGRTAGLRHAVAAQSLAELRSLNVGQWGKWHASAFSENIPPLADVLPLVPAGRRLFVELKVGAEILPELERVLRASGLAPAQLALITFDLATARAVKLRLPAHEVCWVAEPPAPLDGLIRQAKTAGLDGLDLGYKFPIDAAFVQKVHGAGLKLYTWTVDDPAVARAQRAAGIDGLTTNRPGWMREQLSAA
ncbi:glycerophosphodiester phosphodiesterase family protein [Opitutus sp. GAS368]|uniref:glycerophosphodiester phosphodiesterase family protein n=1 Tax=Opitutus sp. GAS368 TaxID=1882749 RepID=UPI00087CB2E6|nr:glycerophosphodiester phosphodiesterase family protein [Opitutus sp. GAS368]SDR81518.1 glycerophosphoryl diester phosphodiesterase [Opitutus sp. GAS368]